MTQHSQIQPDLHALMLQMLKDQSAMKIELAKMGAAITRVTIVPAPEWETIPEAAKRLGVTPQTIRRKVGAGLLQAKGEGKTRQVRL